MKKVLSILCAALLVCSMSVTAFAADEWVPSQEGESTLSPTEKEVPISVTVSDVTGEAAAVYCVQITYESMNFQYTQAVPEYDPKEHSVTDPQGSWTNSTANVKIINHSNAEVYAKTELMDAEGSAEYTTQNGIELSLGSTGLNGQTAIVAEDVSGFGTSAGSHNAGENEKTVTITASGTPTQNYTSQRIATLKVTVSSSSISG